RSSPSPLVAIISVPRAASRRSANATSSPSGLPVITGSGRIGRSSARANCARLWDRLFGTRPLLLQKLGSCARPLSLAEQGENASQFGEALQADLGCTERHARAISLIEHPVRQFPAQARTFRCVDA